MKNTALIGQGVIAVAVLIALVATGVAYVLYDFTFFVSIMLGGFIGIIAALALALGWREPNEPPQGVAAPVAKPAAAPAPVEAAAAPTPAPAAKPAAKPTATAPAPVADAPAAAASTPEFLKEAREGGPDDLKQIKGVGPKLEKTLHGMGIFHFDQIAEWGPSEQAWIDDNLAGFKGRATRDEWVPQAKTLAAGGTTAFSKKVDKGGVY
jgi:predicted flap endonuclease-1-like 5' DNA nuclease